MITLGARRRAPEWIPISLYMGFPKIRGTILGVPIIRIILFGGGV